MTTAIPLPMEQLHAFCERWKIVCLEVFGSVLRDDFNADSDIDLLVTWAPGTFIGMQELYAQECELQAILGRRVDLVTRRAVEESENWIRQKVILSSAQSVYER